MRDMNIALDGTVLLCREDLGAVFDGRLNGRRPNVFTDSFPEIWDSNLGLYLEHSKGIYPDICADCDEYYTYNF